MSQRLHAVFDGRVLLPEESGGLQTNKRYLVTVEDAGEEQYPLTTLATLADDLGVTDLAERHNERTRRDHPTR